MQGIESNYVLIFIDIINKKDSVLFLILSMPSIGFLKIFIIEVNQFLRIVGNFEPDLVFYCP